jgi:hypothetical protein
MNDPYSEKFDLLVTGELGEIKVPKEEFLAYRKAWENHPQKDHIIGEAGFEGIVIYRYFKEVPII